MPKTTFLQLHPSEATVAQIASRIYSAYVIANRVTDENETELINKALRVALTMAKKADDLIRSDDELS